MSYQPLGSRLIVRPIARAEVSKGGIFLPETVAEKPTEATVVSVGPGDRNDRGENIAPLLAAGDVVLFQKYSGTEFKDGDDELILLSERDVLARLT